MYRPEVLVALVALVAASGCGFRVEGGTGQGGDARTDAPRSDADPDAPRDVPTDDAPLIDAPLIDAPLIDAPNVVMTTNHADVADTFLSAINQTTNYSDQTSALADGDGRVALFRFDLSAIPTGAAVSAAELHIWTDSDPGGAVSLYPLLEAWDEAAATWQVRQAAVAWSALGAAPPSRSAAAAGTVTGSVAYTEYTVTISTSVIAGWVAAPGTNHGLAIATANTDGTRFSTRENATVSRRPYLRITHTP